MSRMSTTHLHNATRSADAHKAAALAQKQSADNLADATDGDASLFAGLLGGQPEVQGQPVTTAKARDTRDKGDGKQQQPAGQTDVSQTAKPASDARAEQAQPALHPDLLLTLQPQLTAKTDVKPALAGQSQDDAAKQANDTALSETAADPLAMAIAVATLLPAGQSVGQTLNQATAPVAKLAPAGPARSTGATPAATPAAAPLTSGTPQPPIAAATHQTVAQEGSVPVALPQADAAAPLPAQLADALQKHGLLDAAIGKPKPAAVIMGKPAVSATAGNATKTAASLTVNDAAANSAIVPKREQAPTVPVTAQTGTGMSAPAADTAADNANDAATTHSRGMASAVTADTRAPVATATATAAQSADVAAPATFMASAPAGDGTGDPALSPAGFTPGDIGKTSPTGTPLAAQPGTNAWTAATATQPANLQVAVQMTRAAKSGESAINIQLHPAELGRVEVKLGVDSRGNTTARITAESQSTLDLLQADRSTLARTLTDAGLTCDSHNLTFDLSQQDQQGSQTAFDQQAARHQTARTNNIRTAGTPDASASVTTYNVTLQPGRVDITA